MRIDVFVAISARFCPQVSRQPSLGDIGIIYTHVENRKDVFTHTQPGPFFGLDIRIMPAEPAFSSEIDAQAQKHGDKPGQYHDIVVLPSLAQDAGSRNHTGGHKKYSEGQHGRRYRKDCPASVIEAGVWAWFQHCGYQAKTPELFQSPLLISACLSWTVQSCPL